MSEYFRVLKRIERERHEYEPAPPRLVTAKGEIHCEPPVTETVTEAVPATASAPISSEAELAFARLFDNLRALTKGQALRSVVFAGAAPGDSAHTVVSGLAKHVERLGLTVQRVELTEVATRALLRRHREPAANGGTGLPLVVSGRNLPADGAHSPGADLLLIEARPLSESIDGALVARAGNGLVIVAAPGTTARAALRVAAERARTAGCRTLGLVTYGSQDRMPKWLRRIFASSRSQPGR